LLQKLLDAKLKRVAQDGAAARAAGRNPLAGAKDDDRDDATGGWAVVQRVHGYDWKAAVLEDCQQAAEMAADNGA